ncbi:hypothetical protein N7522_011576 [Penicillium canescens]|uniref:BTB domain-containing protein n=1 Tax=Penicillium canescens TaxID=5083 RepID=A0AAD6ILE4_PENCN|nr:uncharacterized protein N7446_007295 [Penicillium canescens]KAJ5991369.1 hypothetical protein N7522_011576 [Penicillium canescens]KAJ6052656.1 hypothetical protein N7460_003190 [Penicillium canescens]KAJ6063175.1 hypothetical protein N7446_007295 [Penicillium canescens]
MGFPDLQPILQSLLDSGKYSDLMISCEGRNFKVHRAIVCSQSSFFDAAVKGGFKEASLSQVDLPDDELATIHRVISFLYVQDYGETDDLDFAKAASRENIDPHAAMWNNLRVFMAADKFDISPLKSLARTRLLNWIDKNAKSLPLVLQQIWITIPPLETELRDAIIKAISRHTQEFLTHDDSIVIMKDIPDIAIGVLRKVVDENSFLKFDLQRSNMRRRC